MDDFEMHSPGRGGQHCGLLLNFADTSTTSVVSKTGLQQMIQTLLGVLED